MSQKAFNGMQELYIFCKGEVFTRAISDFKTREIAEDVTSDIFTYIAHHAEWFIKQDDKRQMEYLDNVYEKISSKYFELENNEKTVEYNTDKFEKLIVSHDRLVFMEEDEVRANFDVLSNKEKDVVEELFINGRSISEVAEKENVSKNVISQRLSRAKKKIYTRYKKTAFQLIGFIDLYCKVIKEFFVLNYVKII